MKTCNKCKVSKSKLEFGKLSNSPDGLAYYCKACKKLEAKKYRDNNFEKVSASKKAYIERNKELVASRNKKYRNKNKDRIKIVERERKLKNNYGITTKDYDNLVKQQNHCCLICEKYSEKLVVDHNHDTGKVRGLLCYQCNSAFGLIYEDINILVNMIKYKIKELDYGDC